MEKFSNNNSSRKLIPNLHGFPFLGIAVIHTLILFAFVSMLVFIPAFSFWKIKPKVINWTKIIHLLSILWIVISFFMMKILKPKLSKSLCFFFELKFAGFLALAIGTLVFTSASDDPRSDNINDHKFILIGTLLIIYLSYVFIFMALEKSVILLILGTIILFYSNMTLQDKLDIMKMKYSEIQEIDDAFNQLNAMKNEFHLNFCPLVASIKLIAQENKIKIDFFNVEHIREPNTILFFKNKDYESHGMILKKINVSFESDKEMFDAKLKEIWEVYNEKLQQGFELSNSFLIKLFDKYFQLYDSLMNQQFDERLEKKFVNYYKHKIGIEKLKLSNFGRSVIDFKKEDYSLMNKLFIKELSDRLSKVGELNKELGEKIVQLSNSSNH